MARGFESKDVEFQQAEASRPAVPGHALTGEERDRETRRRGLELALSKARTERDAARNPHHQTMLDQAIRALNAQLEQLS
jgi:hypothetical protein